MSTFDGFPTAGLDFLAELGIRDKVWFDAHRAEYNTNVVVPTKAFVSAIGAQLAASIALGCADIHRWLVNHLVS
jgi:uncharacterized protein (DUF2461 family)